MSQSCCYNFHNFSGHYQNSAPTLESRPLWCVPNNDESYTVSSLSLYCTWFSRETHLSLPITLMPFLLLLHLCVYIRHCSYTNLHSSNCIWLARLCTPWFIISAESQSKWIPWARVSESLTEYTLSFAR